MRSKQARGFTLVEVLVAVGVIAIAMPALLLVLSERANSVGYLRDQTYAQWVAANRMAEIRLRGLVSEDNEGVAEMGGRRWNWSIERESTGIDGFVRVDITVGVEEGNGELAKLTGFLRTAERSRTSLSTEG